MEWEKLFEIASDISRSVETSVPKLDKVICADTDIKISFDTKVSASGWFIYQSKHSTFVISFCTFCLASPHVLTLFRSSVWSSKLRRIKQKSATFSCLCRFDNMLMLKYFSKFRSWWFWLESTRISLWSRFRSFPHSQEFAQGFCVRFCLHLQLWYSFSTPRLNYSLYLNLFAFFIAFLMMITKYSSQGILILLYVWMAAASASSSVIKLCFLITGNWAKWWLIHRVYVWLQQLKSWLRNSCWRNLFLTYPWMSRTAGVLNFTSDIRDHNPSIRLHLAWTHNTKQMNGLFSGKVDC